MGEIETSEAQRNLLREWTWNRLAKSPDAYERLVEKLLRDHEKLQAANRWMEARIEVLTAGHNGSALTRATGG